MKRLLKELLPVVEYLCSLPVPDQVEQLGKAKFKLLRFIFDILLNVESGRLRVGPEIIEKLRASQTEIQSLLKRHKSLKQRKKELLAGDTFNQIFVPLMPVLRSLLL